MKKLISIFVLSILVQQPQISFASIFGGTQITNAPQFPNVTLKSVPIPTDQTLYCSVAVNAPICNALISLATMYQNAQANPPIPITAAGIASVFTANKIVVYGPDGTNISPYKP